MYLKLWRCLLRNKELLVVCACLVVASKIIQFWKRSNTEQSLQLHDKLSATHRVLDERSRRKYSDALKSFCSPNVSLQPPQDVTALVNQVEDEQLWAWIVHRIQSTWDEWVQTAQSMKSVINRRARSRKRILIIPGVLMGTPFAANLTIKAGGPLGDLYQWSDVIAALYALGHNLTLTKDFYYVARGLRYDKFLWAPNEQCAMAEFDLVFADIITMKALSTDVVRSKRCLFRVMDAYGTEQMYNNIKYSMLQDFYSMYGQLQLNLKQFYTFYPHTPDNSFMGFAVPKVKLSRKNKENIGVLYGKDLAYFQGKSEYIKQLMKHMSVHCTLNSTQDLPGGLVNHGILTTSQYRDLLARAKYFIGVGEPLESTGVMEALAYGCIFINPKYVGPMQFILQQDGKPTTRKMTSQVPYLEEQVGPPRVLTIDIYDSEQVAKALESSRNSTVKPYVPYEFTMAGVLERVNSYLENQDFCNSSHIWPPTKLARVYFGNRDQSCVDACRENGLLCENVYFRTLNGTTIFSQHGVDCTSVTTGASIYYPAFTDSRQTKCFLQADAEYFSCAGSHEALKRVCPCRKYRKGQMALWDDAG